MKNKMEGVVRSLLECIGEDIGRGGLLETPKRVSKAWDFWTSGYKANVSEILKTFEDGCPLSREMVIVKGIPYYSHCEHHLAPFFGEVAIGYIPSGKVVGLSKLSRLVDVFARRLQIQERMTEQICSTLYSEIGAVGVGVVVTGRHLCMESRGICKQGSETITKAFSGKFCEELDVKNEFLRGVS